MIAFRNYSIPQKLVAMSMIASSGALLLASAAFLTYDFFSTRSAVVKNLSNLGDIIGFNTASAVVFNDAVSASRTLVSLQVRPSIMAAGICTPDGRVFAHWQRDEKPSATVFCSPSQGKEMHEFRRDGLVLFHPIDFDKMHIGTVYIQSDLKELTARVKRYVGIVVVVLFISFIAAALISFQFGQRISGPLLHLAQVAKTISEKGDYAVRATGEGKDEVGTLTQTFNDMLTKIQENEQALRKVHEELEQRVQERTAQLTVSNKELEAFSYSVSHDLRTPLRAIDGFSRELLNESQDKLDAQGKADLGRIRAATQRMSQLIDDLLKLSRVTRSEITREEVDLSATIEKILGDLKASQPDRRVESRISPHLITVGDPQLLRVALENLVGNAWKFTEKRPDAKIEFGILEEDRKRAFFIRDNGAGFNMSYAGKLFGAFQRLHDTREYPGTGIGLATVQRIIHRHGGRIWAKAEVGHGATFFFTLT